jgi:hypothetical protein
VESSAAAQLRFAADENLARARLSQLKPATLGGRTVKPFLQIVRVDSLPVDLVTCLGL